MIQGGGQDTESSYWSSAKPIRGTFVLMVSRVSSDNQDENVATIKVRTRGRDATSGKDDGGLGDAEQADGDGGVSETVGMRRPAPRPFGVGHRRGTANIASRDGPVEGGFSEG